MGYCYNCKNWDSGDSEVGLDAGCVSEHLYDANGDIIDDMNDEITAIMLEERDCPYYAKK